MAITCQRCGAGFDVTLFQFGHRIRCTCGQWVDLATGHELSAGPPAEHQEVPMAEVEIGKVTHYFSKIQVAAILITADSLRVGDTIHFKGHTSDFQQQVASMQIDGKEVQEAKPGDSVGMKVAQHAREHDAVYKVTA